MYFDIQIPAMSHSVWRYCSFHLEFEINWICCNAYRSK